ncbi:hypothetical protein [Marinimicrobium alkaliphilum]|uniref:hypothetical protein n=1 Tax=Marinimicrobium alkaliphilum TaxID=2202654 RepID=UPI0013009DC3|nr:hypothetical protein [Marinimicrobium alkaliphilum]
MHRIAIIAITCLTLCACTTTQQRLPDIDYDVALGAPENTEDFALTERTTFEEPLLGTLLTYKNRYFPTDQISLYVYPIPHFQWDNQEQMLEGEMQETLDEIDHAIDLGHYQSRTDASTEPFSVVHDGAHYEGLKASFEMVLQGGLEIHSNTYLFIEKDKYIKFRTSFVTEETVPTDGDQAVRQILPRLDIPGESEYMHELRAAYREYTTQLFMEALLQMVEEMPEE